MRIMFWLALSVLPLIGLAEENSLSTADFRLGDTQWQPYSARWRYGRADSPDPSQGMQVTATLTREGDRWVHTMTSHFPPKQFGDLEDRIEFHIEDLALARISVPDMPEEDLLYLDLHFDGNLLTRTVEDATGTLLEQQEIQLSAIPLGVPLPYLAVQQGLVAGKTIRWQGFQPEDNTVAVMNATIEVQETIEVMGTMVKAWRVTSGIGTHWVVDQPPYEVRREFRLNDELTIVWALMDSDFSFKPE